MEEKIRETICVNVAQIPAELSKGKLEDKMMIFDNLDQVNSEVIGSSSHPVKTEATLSLHVVKGSVTFMVNFTEVKLEAYQVINIMPKCLFYVIETSPDFVYFCFTISMEFQTALMGGLNVQAGILQTVQRFYRKIGNEQTLRNSMMAYRHIKDELSQPEYPLQKYVIQRYCEILILKNTQFYSQHDHMDSGKSLSRREHIFREFLVLLEHHYKKERSILFYASKLFLTPKYLSTVVKDVSGTHASHWIDEYVIFEAKALLRDGRFSIKQVSDQLNFPSQSMFGRFFKKATSYSPKQYKALQ